MLKLWTSDLRSLSVGGVVIAAALVLAGCSPDEAETDPGAGEQDQITGWQRLAVPPKVRDLQALLATDDRVLVFGGCAMESEDECDLTRNGFSFDPSEGAWAGIPGAPESVTGASVWTGEEAVFLDTGGEGLVRAVAYEPQARTWRTLPEAPLEAKGGSAVWTGSEVIVWGSDRRAGAMMEEGAAYDPAANTWRRLAEAPLRLNAASLVWSGSEMIAFGSQLNNRNRSSTPTAVSAEYDPVADSWRRLPDSGLSPQAHAAEWVDGQLIAYDYLARSQRYDPARNVWSPKSRVPLTESECYPGSAKVAGLMLAFYCGEVALFDPRSGTWSPLVGGLAAHVDRSNVYGRPYRLWHSAALAATQDAVYFLAHGATFSRRGEAQYGFRDSPVSFWSYTPTKQES